MNTGGVNKILREILGSDVWAKSMRAAISLGESESLIREELSKASPEELQALACAIKEQSALEERFINAEMTQTNARGVRLIVQVREQGE